MAVYKVIQDIESEDKLLGPLTLKGFIYAAVAGVSAFLEVRLLIAGGSLTVRLAIMLILLGPMILFGVLASPLGREQPTEVWLLSHIKFLLSSHRRIWDRSGVSQLVTVTAPKREERQLTKGFSQTEVQSRLQALANTLDSRGWAVKDVAVNLSAAPAYLQAQESDSDRLIGPSNIAVEVPVIDVHASDDILDEQNNPTAQHFASLMQQADAERKRGVMDKVNAARSQQPTTIPQPVQPLAPAPWVDEPGQSHFIEENMVKPGSKKAAKADNESITADEQAVLEKKHREYAEIESKMPKNFGSKANAHKKHKTSGKTGNHSTNTKRRTKRPTAGVTPATQAAKLELAQSGNDLSVASIAQLANRQNQLKKVGPNEFEISLH